MGRNGVGKTTLLRICLGERPLDEGTVKIGKRVVFNYIDQARMQLDGTGSVLEEISEGNETVLFGEQRLSARSYLRRFLFSALPLITLLGFGLVAALLRWVPKSIPRLVPAVVGVAIGVCGVGNAT